MSNRLVSVALIVALVSCPLWCGSGQCHGSECGTANETCPSAGDSCDEAGADCCHIPPANDAGEGCPCDKTSCQCLCGGAVVQKFAELDGPAIIAWLPMTLADIPGSALQQARQTEPTESPHRSSGNPGRCVRTLLSSFLC